MNAWDAARHGEGKQVVAAIAVCEIFLRGPDGWERNGESPKSCSHKPFPGGRPLCSPHSHGHEVCVSGGCDQMQHPENVFSSPVYGHAQLNGVQSYIN